MTTDLAAERREGALAANRIRELAENPLRGNFDVDHLRAVHAYIFQDLPPTWREAEQHLRLEQVLGA